MMGAPPVNTLSLSLWWSSVRGVCGFTIKVSVFERAVYTRVKTKCSVFLCVK